MDPTPYQHTETVTVAAPPDAVYDLVADVTRMGEWSPVCKSAEWADASRAWFSGTNVAAERTWTTRCRVDVAERGKEFTFVNCGSEGDTDLVRWSYTFAPAGDGTEASEHWQVLPGFAVFMERVAPGMDVVAYLDSVVESTRDGMRQTLANVKAAAES
jgi:hypothetical protein